MEMLREKQRTSPGQASLLPYLHGVAGDARLFLSLYADTPGYQDRAYPFVVIDDTDATSRLIEARFLTDAGSLLRKVIFLVQKDQYALHDDDQRGVTNSDIDSVWQTVFSSFNMHHHDGRSLVLSSQVDEQGRLVRLASLFFCRERRLFFHPVCPSCGLSLNLCTDDRLLAQHGLQTYSGSAKRYLYCSSCCSLGTPEFYLFDAGRKLLYHGRFDDSTPGNGRPVTGADLSLAVEAAFSGEPFAREQNPAMGCSIKWR